MNAALEAAHIVRVLVGVFAWWPVLWVLDRVWPMKEGGAA